MKSNKNYIKISNSLSKTSKNKPLSRRFIKKYYRQLGFSLTEIMVVVAIIGILASVAIPQYNKYQRKAKQTEAKLMLSGIYTSNLSFNAEWGYSTPNLYQMGFAPSGDILYNVGFSGETPAGTKAINKATAADMPADYNGPPPPCSGSPCTVGAAELKLIETKELCDSSTYGTGCNFLSITPHPTIPATIIDGGITYNTKVDNSGSKYIPKFDITAIGKLGGAQDDVWLYHVDESTKTMLNTQNGL